MWSSRNRTLSRPSQSAGCGELEGTNARVRSSQFLGISRVLSQVHQGFCQDCRPFDKFNQERPPLYWSLREGEAFNELKTVLQKAPVLQLADQSRPYIVTTDASDYAMGAVLSQVWDDGEHPVAFESRKMNPAEQNYPTHERGVVSSNSCVTYMATLFVR